jgi:N-formylglutamate amidohydrolase
MHQPSSLPFTILPASGEAAPVVLSSPHSGRVYPKAVLERLRVNGRTLLPLDDGPIDKLVQLACEAGATLVAARYPRVVVDLNREPDELDPEIVRDAHAMPDMRVTARARAGLGVVPSRIGGQPLWRRPFDADELRRQIDDLYHPYHAQLETLMVERRERLGIAILLDCHSMPNAAALGDPIVDAALGDRFGRSCAGELVSAVEALLRTAGLKVARNRPYAAARSRDGTASPSMAATRFSSSCDAASSWTSRRTFPMPDSRPCGSSWASCRGRWRLPPSPSSQGRPGIWPRPPDRRAVSPS